MNDEMNSLIKRAEKHMKAKEVSETGKGYERIAASIADKREAIKLLKII